MVDDKRKIHDFAIKYHNLYSSPQTKDRDVESTFAEECRALGFQMDCGESFQKEYHVVLNSAEELDKIIDDVSDPYLLGSAIFSEWRYITHWSMVGEDADLLSVEHRKWFIIAFARLATMTDEKEESPFVFEGTFQKFKLISNNICYGPEPDPDDEVEQRLSVKADGGVWLTKYRYGEIDDRPRLLKKEKIPADAETIKRILDTVGRNFEDYDNVLATDVGVWDIELTNTVGKAVHISGSLCPDSFHGLSDYIREQFGRNDLFLFDENPNRVERIEVFYDRHSEIEMKKPVHPEMPYAIWDYHEELKIDRAAETIEHYRKIFDECDVSNIYHIAEGVPSFLDDIDVDAFSEVRGNSPDVYVDPHRSTNYKILITTKNGGTREIDGTFDKNGLPKDWPEFAEDLYNFLSFYGIGEIFDERVYGKTRRRINDLIFCNVVFEDRGKEYCYQADEDYDVGDLLIVPAGADNHDAVVRVESVEYHPAEEAPFPLDKIKHIKRKYDKERDKKLLQ